MRCPHPGGLFGSLFTGLKVLDPLEVGVVSVFTVKLLVALILIAHGLGHALTALPVFGHTLSRTHSTHSWLLSELLGSAPATVFCLALSLISLLGFLGAGLSLAGWGLSQTNWESLTIAASLLSLLSLVLFWNSYPFLVPNKVGVIAVDAFAILSILLLRWPPAVFGG